MTRSTISTLSVVFFLFFISNCVADGTPGGMTKVEDVKTNKEIQKLVEDDGTPGGMTKVEDVKTNKEIQELGRYSVEEYNRSQGSRKGGIGSLKFSKVVEAETQVVAGMKYYLKIEALSKTGVPKIFDAEVVVKAWLKSKQLLNFKPSSGKK